MMHRLARLIIVYLHVFTYIVISIGLSIFSTFVDGTQILHVPTPSNGFWNYGGFHGSNIWASGGRNAPFDHHVSFYISAQVFL